MITDLLRRSVRTAVKLPFAVAWDCISLGNMGDGASTSKVLREHRAQKRFDEALEIRKRLRSMENAKGEAQPPAK